MSYCRYYSNIEILIDLVFILIVKTYNWLVNYVALAFRVKNLKKYS